MRALALGALLLAAGCGSDVTDYMPLQQGNHWVYVVTTDVDAPYQDVTVAGRAPVGEGSGWRLESGMGDCRMAWQHGRLVAAELAGTLYSPPLPIYAESGAKWTGVATTPLGASNCSATVLTSSESLDVAGKKYKTIKCVVTLQAPDDRIQLTTWFFPGMGILRQEQRSGPALTRDRRIDFVSGP